MTDCNFYIPAEIPRHVSLSWTPTNAALVVWCHKCRGGTAIYATVMRRDEHCLEKAVDEHRGCA